MRTCSSAAAGMQFQNCICCPITLINMRLHHPQTQLTAVLHALAKHAACRFAAAGMPSIINTLIECMHTACMHCACMLYARIYGCILENVNFTVCNMFRVQFTEKQKAGQTMEHLSAVIKHTIRTHMQIQVANL